MPIFIIPKPVEMFQSGESLTYCSIACESAIDDDLVEYRSMLVSYLNKVCGCNVLSTAATDSLTIRIRLNQDIPKSGYQLDIADGSASFIVSDLAGLMNSLSTFRQILNQTTTDANAIQLPELHINDEPAYAYRGMHLDVSRHFYPVSVIKKYIDIMSLHKLNVFHWHLTDDQGWRIEIKKYPRLTEIGSRRNGTVTSFTLDANVSTDEEPVEGFYTQEEIREIIAYATERQISIIPEIDMPGHAAAIIAAYPEFGCGLATHVKSHFGIFNHVLNPSERTFEFLENLFAEIAQLFPNEYIHIGGDEVVSKNWHHSTDCHELLNEGTIESIDEVHGYFVNRIEQICNSLGKKIIGWDEIIDTDIQQSAVIGAWQGFDRGLKALEMGHKVIFNPASDTYFNAYQSTSIDEPMANNGLTTIDDVLNFGRLLQQTSGQYPDQVLGGQACIWTEYVATEDQLDYMLLPRLCAVSEVLWNSNTCDLNDFYERLLPFTELLRQGGCHVSDSHFKPQINAEINQNGNHLVTMTSAGGEIFYTLDGSIPDQSSLKYSDAIELSESANIRARTWLKNRNDWYGDSKLTVQRHKALKSTVEVTRNGSANNIDSLTNGKLASNRIYQEQEWFEFDTTSLELVVKLESIKTFNNISLGCRALHRLHHLADKLSIEAKRDGDWVLIAEQNLSEEKITNNRYDISFNACTTDSIRLLINNPTEYWSEEREQRLPATLILDEIVIN